MRLSRQELAYLQQSSFLSEPLARRLKGAPRKGDRWCLLEVTPQVAERFRSELTDHLAQVGFDEDYGLTTEGELLEGLLDRFDTDWPMP